MSDILKQLWETGTLSRGIWETVYMTFLSTLIAYIVGLPLGVVLAVTGEGGIRPMRWLNRALGIIVNVFRSIPFIVLMVAMLPVAKVIVGTSIGNAAMIVMLVIAAAPYVARMVESSLKEVSPGVIEAAQSMGTSDFGIIRKVLIPEAKPALIVGAVISEWLGGFWGLGVYMTRVRKSFSYDRMFAVIIIISALSLALMRGVDVLERICMPWKRAERNDQQ